MVRDFPNDKELAKISSGTILAFDFGLRRIGVASGQFITRTASPVTTLIATDGIPKQAELAKLFKDFKPTAVVVGLPLNQFGGMHEISYGAKKFANRIGQNYNVPVFMIDEESTSVAAENILADSTVRKTHRKKIKDRTAAVLILERWFSNIKEF